MVPRGGCILIESFELYNYRAAFSEANPARWMLRQRVSTETTTSIRFTHHSRRHNYFRRDAIQPLSTVTQSHCIPLKIMSIDDISKETGVRENIYRKTYYKQTNRKKENNVADAYFTTFKDSLTNVGIYDENEEYSI